MEVVLISTVLAHITIGVIDKYSLQESNHTEVMRRKRKRSDDETQEYSENKEEIVPCSESKDRDGSEEEEKARMRHEKVDEDSIPSLEARVKALRVEASQLTSADTFVQYARVTREANRLEKRLTELKGTCFVKCIRKQQIIF